LLIMFSSDF